MRDGPEAIALALLAAAGAAVAAASGVAAYSDGPPPGHTGGFGEPTCGECHRGARSSDSVRLTVEGIPARYAPGSTYRLTVVLRAPGLVRGGFQLASRYLSGEAAGRQAGALEARDRRVEVVTDGAPDSVAGPATAYARQTLAGSTAPGDEPPDGRLAWTLTWRSPRGECGGDGPVAVDVAANASNDDASEFGDRIVSTRVVVPPCRDSAWSGRRGPGRRERP